MAAEPEESQTATAHLGQASFAQGPLVWLPLGSFGSLLGSFGGLWGLLGALRSLWIAFIIAFWDALWGPSGGPLGSPLTVSIGMIGCFSLAFWEPLRSLLDAVNRILDALWGPIGGPLGPPLTASIGMPLL